MKFWKSAAILALAASGNLIAQQQPAQTPPQNTPPAPSSNGKVIFSRSIDANGETKTESAVQPQLAKAPVATDDERSAVTITGYDLEVRLGAEHHLAARADLTVRNDGKTPLARIPLEISSTLNWEHVRVANQDAAFEASTLNSDADHTGQLHEAAIPLPTPLAPGATIKIEALYSGAIEQSSKRLLSIGTPDDLAARSDWDRIDTDFTGLRGFGNVAWYPVAAPPVILGDGARLFDEIADQKRRMAQARFRLRLAVEFPHGQPPTIALVNGYPIPITVTDPPTAGIEISGVATGESPATTLGFELPSLFVAQRHAHPGDNLTAWTTPSHDPDASSWTQAEKSVTPFVEKWLGKNPHAQLTLLDLPEPDDAPFEAGSMLATGIRDADPEQIKAVLAHALSHAFTCAQTCNRPLWLSEGVAFFLGALWTERPQGSDKALQMLEADRQALALAEPESPGQNPGTSLAVATSPVYFRTKAAYVLWMLRSITSDDALAAALSAWDAAKETTEPPSELESLLTKSANANLHWFFADWVDADHGLPDLSIKDVFTSAEQSGNWLVAVRVANAGYAAVEVPVTVRNGQTFVTQRVRVPAQGEVTPRILIQGKPTQVQVNDGSIPETGSTVHLRDIAVAAAPAKP